MLDADRLSDVQGDGDLILRAHRFAPDQRPNIRALLKAWVGVEPEWARIRTEGARCILNGQPRIFCRHRTPLARAIFVWLHEAAHIHYDLAGLREDPEIVEAMCNALAAALLAPRAAFRLAIFETGYDVPAIADAFRTTQSVALLRIGEVVGNPVVLLRPPTPIVRGADFAWPPERELARVVKSPPPGVASIRIADETKRWGLLAA
jgi:hypothetical protein